MAETDRLTDIIYEAGPRADPAPIAAAIRAHIAPLVEENKRLRAHYQDRCDEARVRNFDAYETRKDLEALVEALVEKCQYATDENEDARWMLMELRTILACRLPFDEDYAVRLFESERKADLPLNVTCSACGTVWSGLAWRCADHKEPSND